MPNGIKYDNMGTKRTFLIRIIDLKGFKISCKEQNQKKNQNKLGLSWTKLSLNWD